MIMPDNYGDDRVKAKFEGQNTPASETLRKKKCKRSTMRVELHVNKAKKVSSFEH